MPITYKDKALQEPTNTHPAFELNIHSPLYEMKRYGVRLYDDRLISVFKWTSNEAIAAYKWYIQDYNPQHIIDEFGDEVRTYEWQKLIKSSYYMVDVDEPSSQTIQELWVTYMAKEVGVHPDTLESGRLD